VVEIDVAPIPTISSGAEPPTGSTLPTSFAGADEPKSGRFRLHPLPIAVLAVGLALTATLALTAHTLHDNNEERLLRQRVHEAGAVLTAATSGIDSPLSSAAILAEGTNANEGAFSRLMGPLTKGRPFVSASVWSANARNPRPLFVIGAAPALARRPGADIRAFLDRTRTADSVVVLDRLAGPDRGLGYAYRAGPNAKFVVYAEASFPQNRRATVESNSAFADLDYAIYLGNSDDPRHMLASSVAGPRLTGRTAADPVPFGDTKLYLVMSPRRDLGGGLLARLPWLILASGIAISIAAALLTERLVRRRAHAEYLAQQNARMFSEQRSVAQTLQHSLLPADLPEFPGLELAVRYVPGVDGVDIGGDWYDVVGVDDGRVLLVVGDVSGRGLRAATVMASLRYAIRAYAAQGDAPEVILFKLSRLIEVGRDGHFATVLCGLVDVAGRSVSFANAGHPRPILLGESGAELVATITGAPVGVAVEPPVATTVIVPPGGTLLAYTDGLFERRGESPDVGLARLCDATAGYDSLDDLLDGLLHELTPDGGNDDTAILAVRWRP
jgi:serine phosphatase RsbU (regulator of sigma subunit)